MKAKTKFFFLILFLLIAVSSRAQQQVMFTQYMFNQLAINPAYAGSQGSLSITGLARKQWSGIEGAPNTQTLSAHSPIGKSRVGVGLLFLHDQIGVTKQTGLYNSYSYTIPFDNGGQFSFGIQGGFTTYNAQFSQVSSTDPTFANSDIKETHPNVGAGISYSTSAFYVGFSVPQLLQTAFDRDNPDSDAKMIRHYFLTAGYVFDLNPQLKLKPGVLVKAVAGAPVQMDLNLSLLMKQIVWAGVSWRSFESVDAIIQFQVSPSFRFGYAYDFSTTTELSRLNSGSHELMINYLLVKKGSRKTTPKYF